MAKVESATDNDPGNRISKIEGHKYIYTYDQDNQYLQWNLIEILHQREIK